MQRQFLPRNHWKPEEIAFLQEIAGTDEIDALVGRFRAWAVKNGFSKRSYNSITVKMKRLGISLRPIDGGWNCATLAQALDCDRDRVHDWIQRGLLKSSRYKNKRHHRITQNDFKAFAKAHPCWLTDIDPFNLETILGSSMARRAKEAPKMTCGRKMPIRNKATGQVYPSIKAAARHELFHPSVIKDCATTGRKTRCGRQYEFVLESKNLDKPS